MKDITELVIIIDKSGSMHGLEQDVVGGFNSLIDNQKKEGETLVTTIFFNNEVRFVHEQADIKSIEKLERNKYNPSGCTALLDAIGDAICFIKSKHASLPADELPSHVIFSIMTDGLENASREYDYKKIKEMIEFQKKCGWEFIFQAANIDVEHESHRLGIDPKMAFRFEASAEGLAKQAKYCNAMISNARKRN